MRLRLFIVLFALACGACGDGEPAPITFEDTTEGGESAEETEPETGPETTEELVVSGDGCETDADCVPAVCCHASACVARSNAPSCGDAICSTDCQGGTIDCFGGGCLCHEGHCAARITTATIQVQ